MSAPDFYFAINAMFRHIHDRFGKDTLVDYWRKLGEQHYAQRWQKWRTGGLPTIAQDWRAYFDKEPGAVVDVIATADRVTLQVHTCPAIAHLRKHDHEVTPYFCEHCDHINSAMAEPSGHRFERLGGMGSCTQHFVTLTHSSAASASSHNSPAKG